MALRALLLGLACSCVSALVTEPRLNTTMLLPTDFDSYHFSTWAVDYGAVEDEPLMHPEYEWDEEIGGKGTILVDPIDHLYKAWYISQPGIDATTYDSGEGAVSAAPCCRCVPARRPADSRPLSCRRA